MSNLWFYSDCHFNHGNICIYAGRPCIKPEWLNEKGWWVSPEAAIACAEHMNEWLIGRINSRVKDGDTVIHVGDFCNKGRNKGVEGLRESAAVIEKKLNGKWIFTKGNHDKNNGLKYGIDFMKMKIAKLDMFIQHRPVYDLREIPDDTDLCVVGHVHEKWKVNWIEDSMIPNINVGPEVNDYYPIRLDELVGKYGKLMGERWREKNELGK